MSDAGERPTLDEMVETTVYFPPADCTTACMDGPCDCSGKSRPAKAYRSTLPVEVLGDD